jgi:hypothetical protein
MLSLFIGYNILSRFLTLFNRAGIPLAPEPSFIRDGQAHSPTHFHPFCGVFPRSPRQNSAQTSVAATVFVLGTRKSRDLQSPIAMANRLIDWREAS